MLNTLVKYVGNKAKAKFNRECLKQGTISCNHGKVVNIYIYIYEIDKYVNISCYPMLESCLYGAVKLTKHVDIDLYKYTG